MKTINFILHLTFMGLAFSRCPWELDSDPNPHRPKFPEHEYFHEVSPDTPKGYEIMQFSATDEDVNDTLLFSIEECPRKDFLQLNETSGVLSTRKSFDQLTELQLICYIYVRDRPDLDDPDHKHDRAKLIIIVIGLRPEQSEPRD